MSSGTGRISLRAVQAEDLATIFRYQLDEEANRVAVARARDESAFRAHWQRVLDDPAVIARVIDCEGEVVGDVSTFVGDGKRWLGYWIDRAHWGMGIASEAVRLLLLEVEERPLYARVASSNAGSLRVLERNGFVALERVWFEGDERFPACEETVYRLD